MVSPHAVRYKHCLALALDGDWKAAEEVKGEAQQLEDQFEEHYAGQMAAKLEGVCQTAAAYYALEKKSPSR